MGTTPRPHPPTHSVHRRCSQVIQIKPRTRWANDSSILPLPGGGRRAGCMTVYAASFLRSHRRPGRGRCSWNRPACAEHGRQVAPVVLAEIRSADFQDAFVPALVPPRRGGTTAPLGRGRGCGTRPANQPKQVEYPHRPSFTALTRSASGNKMDAIGGLGQTDYGTNAVKE